METPALSFPDMVDGNEQRRLRRMPTGQRRSASGVADIASVEGPTALGTE
jgi:hypothetical protein